MRRIGERWRWLWLGALLLALVPVLVAVALANFIRNPDYPLIPNPWMIAGFLAFVGAFASFYAAASNWTATVRARLGFPDVVVEITSVGSTETERESASGLDVPAQLRTINVRFASLVSDRPVTMDVLLYVKLVPGSWGRAAEAVCPPPTWALAPSLGLNPIVLPVVLTPGGSISGQLVYEIPGYYRDKIAHPAFGRLELADQESGKRKTMPAELGRYDTASMSPAEGGARLLGPEFELRQEPESDVTQISQ